MMQKRTLEKMVGALDGVTVVSNRVIEVRVDKKDDEGNREFDSDITEQTVMVVLNQLRLRGEDWGGFKCGHGGWELRKSYKPNLHDYCDHTSPHHY